MVLKRDDEGIGKTGHEQTQAGDGVAGVGSRRGRWSQRHGALEGWGRGGRIGARTSPGLGRGHLQLVAALWCEVCIVRRRQCGPGRRRLAMHWETAQ